MKIDDDVSIMPYNMIVVHKNGKIVLESGCEIGMFSRVAAKNLVQIGKNGIIRDAKVHQNVLESVTAMAVEEGFSVLGLDFSPIQGGHGNIEFLVYLKKEESASNQVLAEIEEVVERAHSQFKNE